MRRTKMTTSVHSRLLSQHNISGLNGTANVSYEELLALVQVLLERTEAVERNIDFAWIITSTIGILSMQVGFTLLEVGTVQSKNVKSVLLKNACDLLFGKLMWWAVGFGLYCGDNKYFSGPPWLFFMVESSVTFDDDWPHYYLTFIQQYAFAITSSTIVSGAVMSRLRFETYVWFSMVYTGVIYPICAHWAWKGWLSSDIGFVDFAGSGVVHMTGGVAALIFSSMLGPRVGRFEEKPVPPDGTVTVVRALPGSDPVSVVTGGLLLYVAWFFFNAGSSSGLSGEAYIAAARAMATTSLGAASGGSVATLYNLLVDDNHDVPVVINGLLVGLVSVTAGAATFDLWAALLVGATAALTYVPVSRIMLHHARIDDPIDGFTIHGFGGAYGCLMVGFFSQDIGLVYTGSLAQLRAQLIGVLTLGSFVALTVFLWILLLNKCMSGRIRLPYEQQLMGLDLAFHSGYDHPEQDDLAVREQNLQKQRREKRIKEAAKRAKLRERKGSLRGAAELLESTLGSKTKIIQDPLDLTQTVESKSEASKDTQAGGGGGNDKKVEPEPSSDGEDVTSTNNQFTQGE